MIPRPPKPRTKRGIVWQALAIGACLIAASWLAEAIVYVTE